MNSTKTSEDKVNCFARLSKGKCNALSKKNCECCSFYKHYSEVKDYVKYLPKDFKRNETIASKE